MIQSDYFGRTFWLSKDNYVKSAPTFVDNSVDYYNWDYVSNWDDFEGVNMNKLFEIVAQLITQKEERLAHD